MQQMERAGVSPSQSSASGVQVCVGRSPTRHQATANWRRTPRTASPARAPPRRGRAARGKAVEISAERCEGEGRVSAPATGGAGARERGRCGDERGWHPPDRPHLPLCHAFASSEGLETRMYSRPFTARFSHHGLPLRFRKHRFGRRSNAGGWQFLTRACRSQLLPEIPAAEPPPAPIRTTAVLNAGRRVVRAGQVAPRGAGTPRRGGVEGLAWRDGGWTLCNEVALR